MSLREHTLRLTADEFWLSVGLHFWMGALTDRPLDRWQEAFLPERLRDLLREVRIERDGLLRPLVKSERVMFQARRPPPPQRAPGRLPGFALVGFAVGALLVALGWAARRLPGARVALGALAALLGLTLGLLGSILIHMWIFTSHRPAHANANVLLCAPWLLALAPLGIGVALGRPRAQRWAFRVTAAAAALALLGAAAKLLPGPAQNNTAFLLLLIPLWVGLAAGLHSSRPDGVDGSAPAWSTDRPLVPR
jgi:hypothetical protein